MADKFQLSVNLIANTDDLQKGLRAARSQLKTALGGWNNVDFATNLTKGFAATAVAAGVGASAMVNLAAKSKMTKIAFDTLIGSQERSNQFWNEMNDFATKTPFDVAGVQEAAKKMMAYGTQVDDIIPRLRILGDASAAVGLGSDGIDRMTVALGQMNAAGKVTRGDLNQLVAVGINVWEILSQQLGKDVPTVMKEVGKGAIDAKTGIDALLKGIDARFGGMMKNTEGTVSNSLNTIEESAGIIAIEIGQQLTDAFNLEPTLKSVADSFSNFSEELRTKGIGNMINEMVTPETVAILSTLGTILLPTLTAGFVNLTLKGISGAITGLTAVGNAMTGLPATMMSLASGVKSLALAIATLALNPVTLGIVAVAVAAYGAYTKFSDLDNIMNTYSGTVKDLHNKNEKIGNSVSNLSSEADELANSMNSVNEALGNANNASVDYISNVDQAVVSAESAKVSDKDLAGAVYTLSEELDNLINKSGLSSQAQDELALAEQNLHNDFENGVISLRDYYEELIRLREATLNAKAAMGMSVDANWMSSGSSDDYDRIREGSVAQKIMTGEVDITGSKIKPKNNVPNTSPSPSPSPGSVGGSSGSAKDDPLKKEDEITSKTIAAIQKRVQAQITGNNNIKSAIQDRYDYENKLMDLVGNSTISEVQSRLSTQAGLYNELSILDSNYQLTKQGLEEQAVQASLINDNDLKNATLERINEEMAAEKSKYEMEKTHIQELQQLEAARYAALPTYAQTAYDTIGILMSEMYSAIEEYNANEMEWEQQKAAKKAQLTEDEYNTWLERAETMRSMNEEDFNRWLEQQAQKIDTESTNYAWRMEQEQGLQELGQQTITNAINGLGEMIMSGGKFGDVMKNVLKQALSGLMSLYATMIAKGLIQEKSTLGTITKLAAAQKAATASILPGLVAAATAYATLHPGAPAIAAANLSASTSGAIAAMTGLAAFARGGLVTGPVLGMVGEGKDEEMVLPLNSNTLGVLSSQLAEYLGYSTGGASSSSTEINLYGDINNQGDFQDVLNEINDAVSSGLRGAK